MMKFTIGQFGAGFDIDFNLHIFIKYMAYSNYVAIRCDRVNQLQMNAKSHALRFKNAMEIE